MDVTMSTQAISNDREKGHWTNKLAFPSEPSSFVTFVKRLTKLNKWWVEIIFNIIFNLNKTVLEHFNKDK